MNDDTASYEALVQFLYRAPVGLLQTFVDGQIDLMNPMASQLLMPLVPDGDISNLFAVLRPWAPQLRSLCDEADPQHHVICEALRISLPASPLRPGAAAVLSLGLMRIAEDRLMAVLVDATQETQREQQTLARRIRSAAQTDTLSQLPNRAALRDLLQTAASRQRAPAGDACALLFINFDRFKQINDTLGNAIGDRVIRLVADRLRASLRTPARRNAQQSPGDKSAAPLSATPAGLPALAERAAPGADAAQPAGDAPATKAGVGERAARVGGDEFAVLLDGIADEATAVLVANRLQQALSAPYRVDAHDINCAFSVGLVCLDGALPAADELLRDASIAVATAKAEGGGRCVVFRDAMRTEAARRGEIEAELRLAIERGDLFVVYQPVVGLAPGDVVDRSAGVEALVRWQHATRGMVSPVEFIGIAEECGLISAIGEFVLRTACRDLMHWQATLGALAPRLLAVNLSRAQLLEEGLVDTVRAVLADYAMQPAQLQLEITESLAAQGTGIQAQLRELKNLGVQLALDDFGTGYSSLSSLHLLPVDTVKIDRSFVTLSATSFHHQVLIEATVKVARSLGMGTVAEGIETPAQAAIVLGQGCDKAQGYMYSKPVTADRLAAWLQADAASAAPGPAR